jgi:hypothetical protein
VSLSPRLAPSSHIRAATSRLRFNARFRAAVRPPRPLPDEQSALKVLFLTICQCEKPDPTPPGRINDWKQIVNT